MYGRDTLAEPMAGTAALGQSGPTGTGTPRQTRNAQGSAFSSDPGTFARDFLSYGRDVAERWILFWDTLRQRADNMLAHERAGKPALLDFDYEVLLDARRLERPANYALLRVTRVGDECLEDCLDAAKPPVVILDPRAGHGPGIGGFKQDSEVGIALHQGHPVYFVTFYPEPAAGQTLADVLHVLRRFVEEVSWRHSGAAPVLYGNCQAGWAVTLLAANCAGLAGPAVLNGTPLSYWAGETGINPMRIAAGFEGGAWLTHLLADLGDGRFDGAFLVQNFEGLKPEAVWEKYANLYAHMDTERERFLAFERWWGGYYFLSREEILAIVENFFVGNRLEQGRVRICEGCHADLRRIRNPLVIFASYGDNITPPHQALGWLPIVYQDTEDLKAAGQRIVYLINRHVGHLGIFVSAKVARLEHRAILESLPRIETLPPGLYEMKIDNPSGDPDCREGAYQVRFEAREVSDIRFARQDPAFERVRDLSERNEAFYRTFVSPWVRALTTPWSAAMLETLHPMRTSRYLLSEGFMPWMRDVRWLAEQVAADRHPAAADNPFKVEEEHVVSRVAEGIEQGRRLRDALWERLFDSLYDGVGSAHPAGADPQHRSEGTGPQDTRSGLDFQAAGISRTAAIGEN
ncbi:MULTISPECIES: DUF3141 domain-containing protein [Xanthobacteraceae]|jgi:hypothetical protein|uniref:Poly(3-hydroxyalkanoate) synthetase n=2 Tax=Xanthobacter TaxID=279 RepID=A0A9W6CNA1_XANFL|nr:MULTISPECIES: DUF3141 domain-containing protein [Xanthobacter]MCG5233516.1 DUF3141 domain-containing protein [Xanthobacter oligotrophicus]MDI4663318.1 DUF3141 domain-containing protein [Xanthobacter autotrophicus]GLI25528.1 hypothetical protein XFLAVUS301_52020 [Xanthobacter flavus]